MLTVFHGMTGGEGLGFIEAIFTVLINYDQFIENYCQNAVAESMYIIAK